MSRYRVPAEPILIALAAGWLGQRRYGPGEGWRRGLAIAGIVGLVALWAQNAREVAAVVRNALG